MENLDYFNLITAPEAPTISGSFGLTEERCAELEKYVIEGCKGYADAMSKKLPLTRTDLFLYVSRAGFIPKNAAEVVFVTFIITKKIVKNDILNTFAHVLDHNTAKMLFALLERSNECDCDECKKRKGLI